MSYHKMLLGIAIAALFAGPLWGADELEKQATWTPPTAAQVKEQIDKWLAERELDEATQKQLAELWPADKGPQSGAALLDRVAETISLIDEPSREVIKLCQDDLKTPVVPNFQFLTDKKLDPLVANNLRLLFGRWLAQQDMYDEALLVLNGLEPTDVVDPASLLFFQSAGYHRLLDKKNCLPRIAKLLENSDTIPRRYATVARLMEADLKPLKTDSLDEVSRLMDDIRRRLGLGRAGTKVRKQEDDVIAKLDKLIEELEKKKGGGGGKKPGGGNLQPSKPAPDSAPLGGKGEGNVDAKSPGSESGWGNLPPKERQAALQRISKDLPAHYREVIEEYFRKLARDGS